MLQIEKRHLEIIVQILAKYRYGFFAFGSRVMGNAKRLSDLDIFYKDAIPLYDLHKLEEEFEESDLPFKVDIVDYNKCDDDFKKIIMSNYIQMQ